MPEIRRYSYLADNFERQAASLGVKDLPLLKQHYLQAVGMSYSGDKYYGAVLAAIVEPTALEAADAVSARLPIRHSLAQKLILEGLVTAPEEWQQKNGSLLERKGFLKGRLNYYIARPCHEPGSLFARTHAAIPEEREPILQSAIDETYKKGNFRFRLSDGALLGVAIQLMDHNDKRREAIRTANQNFASNGQAWQRSAMAVQVFAKELGIPLDSLPKPYGRNFDPD